MSSNYIQYLYIVWPYLSDREVLYQPVLKTCMIKQWSSSGNRFIQHVHLLSAPPPVLLLRGLQTFSLAVREEEEEEEESPTDRNSSALLKFPSARLHPEQRSRPAALLLLNWTTWTKRYKDTRVCSKFSTKKQRADATSSCCSSSLSLFVSRCCEVSLRSCCWPWLSVMPRWARLFLLNLKTQLRVELHITPSVLCLGQTLGNRL